MGLKDKQHYQRQIKMITNPKTLATLQIPEFVKRIPDTDMPVHNEVYEFIRNILLLKDVVAEHNGSTDECQHIFIKRNGKVLFEYIESYINERACIYTGNGHLVAACHCDANTIPFLNENPQKPNYMEILADLIFWKASWKRTNVIHSAGWLRSQKAYNPMVRYVLPLLRTRSK